MDGVTHLQVVSYVLKLGHLGITMRHEVDPIYTQQ